MHELGIARDVVRRVSEEAALRRAGRVTRIRLSVGPVGGYQDDALSFALAAAAAGTEVEGVRFVIRRVPEGGVTLESIDLEEAR